MAALHAPTLLTPRLELRELSDADAPFLVELLNDPGWLEHIGDRGVRTEADARAYLDTGPRASYRAHGSGLMRVGLRGDDTPIGICGLVHRDTLPGPDLGYAVVQRFAGQGYASEAARASLADAFGRLALAEVLAITGPEHHASLRLLRRLGFETVEHRVIGDAASASVILRCLAPA